MNAITLWLLVVSAQGHMGSNGGVSTIAQFATADECRRVQAIVGRMSVYLSTQCIQATVVRP